MENELDGQPGSKNDNNQPQLNLKGLMTHQRAMSMDEEHLDSSNKVGPADANSYNKVPEARIDTSSTQIKPFGLLNQKEDRAEVAGDPEMQNPNEQIDDILEPYERMMLEAESTDLQLKLYISQLKKFVKLERNPYNIIEFLALPIQAQSVESSSQMSNSLHCLPTDRLSRFVEVAEALVPRKDKAFRVIERSVTGYSVGRTRRNHIGTRGPSREYLHGFNIRVDINAFYIEVGYFRKDLKHGLVCTFSYGQPEVAAIYCHNKVQEVTGDLYLRPEIFEWLLNDTANQARRFRFPKALIELINRRHQQGY